MSAKEVHFFVNNENTYVKLNIDENENSLNFLENKILNLEEFVQKVYENSNSIYSLDLKSKSFDETAKKILVITNEINPDIDICFNSYINDLSLLRSKDDFILKTKNTDFEIQEIRSLDPGDFFYKGNLIENFETINTKETKKDLKKFSELIKSLNGNFNDSIIDTKENGNFFEISRIFPDGNFWENVFSDGFSFSTTKNGIEEIVLNSDKIIPYELPTEYKNLALNFDNLLLFDDKNNIEIIFEDNDFFTIHDYQSSYGIEIEYKENNIIYKNDYNMNDLEGNEKDAKIKELIKKMKNTLDELKKLNNSEKLKELSEAVDKKVEEFSLSKEQRKNIEKTFDKIKDIYF